jgi:ZIP family zinc transporter
MSTGHILLLGAIAGLTIFIGLPMGRLHDVGQSFKAFLSATATGILLFLLWDVLSHATGASSPATRRWRSAASRSGC